MLKGCWRCMSPIEQVVVSHMLLRNEPQAVSNLRLGFGTNPETLRIAELSSSRFKGCTKLFAELAKCFVESQGLGQVAENNLERTFGNYYSCRRKERS